MSHKLIALLDGSSYAESVCDHAVWVAKKKGASIELLHVLGRRSGAGEGTDLSGNIGLGARSALLEELADIDARRAKLELMQGRHLLDAAESRLRDAGVEQVSGKLRHGDLIEAVEDFEKEADLIVIGKRGEAADFAKLHLGSNLERVVRAASKPVLVASRAFKPVNSVLIAYDGGPSAMKAVWYVAKSNLFKDIPCTLVMVGAATDEARKKMDEAAGILSTAKIEVETSFETGDPDNAIKAKVEREGFDMLVMGAYGHSRIRNLIIGSTTTEMVRSCLVPVMLFR
ncbi:universal stress protein [Kordiimonas sp.]|uniref:universal stress protein n=1 Tax=Kordiimonas sp. TaxID=1970157 RepID=UPI003A8FE37B